MQTAEASAESRSRLSFVATGRGTGRGRLSGRGPPIAPARPVAGSEQGSNRQTDSRPPRHFNVPHPHDLDAGWANRWSAPS